MNLNVDSFETALLLSSYQNVSIVDIYETNIDLPTWNIFLNDINGHAIMDMKFDIGRKQLVILSVSSF